MSKVTNSELPLQKQVDITSMRNSSIELLRILAMFFIVISHRCCHTNFPSEPSLKFFNNVCISIGVLGNIGVDIFILITGYFLIDGTRKTSSISKLIIQVWFYSLIGIIFLICTKQEVRVTALIKSFFPIISHRYWFISVYILFIFLSPYINRFLNMLTQKQYELLICSIMLLLSIIPTVSMMGYPFDNDITAFFSFYTIGGYLKKYPDNIFKKIRIRNISIIGSFSFIVIADVIFSLIGINIEIFVMRFSIPVVLISVCLVANAIYSKPFFSRGINKIASCVFGVYLLHEHPFIRNVLWNNIMPIQKYYDSYLLIPVALVSVFLVFAAGTFIELLRKKIPCNWLTTHLNFLVEKLDFARDIF